MFRDKGAKRASLVDFMSPVKVNTDHVCLSRWRLALAHDPAFIFGQVREYIGRLSDLDYLPSPHQGKPVAYFAYEVHVVRDHDECLFYLIP